MRWIFVETLKEEEDVCIDLFFDGAVWFEYDTLACLHLSGSTYLAERLKVCLVIVIVSMLSA